MAGIANGMKPNSITGSQGPSPAVASEFVAKTPARKRKMFSKNLRKKDSYA